MTVLNKDSIFNEFGKNKKDTGSAESQIALFSKRIDFQELFNRSAQG